MATQTPAPWSIPYPIGTDRVMDGDNAMQAIAERTHALLAQSLKNPPVPQTQVSLLNAWTGQVSYFGRAGMCMVFVQVAKAAWAAQEVVASIPDPYRPYLSLYSMAVGLNTAVSVPAYLSTDGGLRVVTGTVAGAGGFVTWFTFPYGNTLP